jgi:hypothetical protein
MHSPEAMKFKASGIATRVVSEPFRRIEELWKASSSSLTLLSPIAGEELSFGLMSQSPCDV